MRDGARWSPHTVGYLRAPAGAWRCAIVDGRRGVVNGVLRTFRADFRVAVIRARQHPSRCRCKGSRMTKDDYRRRQQERAEECRAFAEATTSQQARASFSRMAEAFDVLAEDSDRLVIRRKAS